MFEILYYCYKRKQLQIDANKMVTMHVWLPTSKASDYDSSTDMQTKTPLKKCTFSILRVLELWYVLLFNNFYSQYYSVLLTITV